MRKDSTLALAARRYQRKQQNQALLKKHGAMVNIHGVRLVTVFNFLGNQYSTNLNRTKEYSLKDSGWVVKELGFLKKMWMIKNNKVRKLNARMPNT